MHATRLPIIVLLVMSLARPAEAGSSGLPDLAAPPHGAAQWIARKMRMNGLPMTLKAFKSKLSPDAVLAHYESVLKTSSSYETRRHATSPWQVLTVRSPEYLITVHARTVSTGSEGTILVSPALGSARLHLRTDFPRPPNTRIVNLQQYDDVGMASEHIGLSSDRSPFVEAQAFSQLLIRDGWTMLETRPTQETHRGFVLEAQRDAEQVQLVIIPDAARTSNTAIVITWKKS